ncbi:MAG: alpha-glucan family phosphorylase [Candidatus Eisenbacteria sp.]|nr:alpha-glucan family phosphorylase [Candidatus Eisenbacteria bacterium]
MRTIQKFRVRPTLPERIGPLMDIAKNLWWTWNPEAVALFRRIDPDLWRQTHHNPIGLLARTTQERLNDLATKETFLAHMDRVHNSLRRYMNHPTWYSEVHTESQESRVAYFSAEFGLHESLPFYAGGLGVLAGDHLKSASELGLPVAGVGLLYRRGYFHQQLDQDGMQREIYREIHFSGLPLEIIRAADGSPELLDIDLAERTLKARIWRVQVGRVPLFLLDTDISENEPRDRRITERLYDADLDVRIRQEIVLGVGGMRALECFDVTPTVCHLNEGHSAFLTLERIASLMEKHGLEFKAAMEIVKASNVFTLHTPVPAGNDVFPTELAALYLKPFCRRMHVSIETLLDLGRTHPQDPAEGFSMTVLALRLSTFRNGVSKLHGEVARSMWRSLWPHAPEDEIPIGHITNGVHIPSWYSDEIAHLFDRYLGPEWLENPVDQVVWERVSSIPPAELWRARERLRTRFVAEARQRLTEHLVRRGAHAAAIRQAGEVLDPETLTIGFARRFATYKRALLLFRDLDRFAKIVGNPRRPVQFIFSGKAHPQDQPGKEIIREIIRIARRPEFRRHIVFLEDYDIELARTMVQGVDVWLNTPLRPLEASGTSGMKVVVNGGLNLSVLDGWWCEGYNGENGWAIGNGETYDDPDYHDRVESEALYNILEDALVPLFYDRGPDGLPREWIRKIRASMMTLCPKFNTNRAAAEYTRLYYIPALLNWNWLVADDMKRAREITKWKAWIKEKWHEVRVLEVKASSGVDLAVGDRLTAKASVALNSLTPEDVKVEIFYGRMENGHLRDGRGELMSLIESHDGVHEFGGMIGCRTSGHFGFCVRVTPRSAGLDDFFDRELVSWWQAGAHCPGILQH